jgi:hypothetical protein
VFVDGELEIVETASWFPKVARKDYLIGANLTGGGVDDPDQQLYENYGCGSPRNYTGYCNPELEQLFVARGQRGGRRSDRAPCCFRTRPRVRISSCIEAGWRE